LEKSDIKQLSKLCRIQISDEEATSLAKDFESIFTYVDQLKEIPTEGVDPCFQVVSYKENVFGEDEIGDVILSSDYLKNAQAHVGNLIKTPPVIKF
jgi:aspartyl-tRNA(Asn)/glutamyl-tRNA(Gln) amidotransferase subunit C